MLRPIVEEAPSSPSARVLLGLTHYRMGQWKAAAQQLEAFRALSDSTEQHPVLADCYRALRRWDRVDALWLELRAASPDAAIVAEGRIVMAGSWADRGRLDDAIALLQRARRPSKRPQDHHLRTAYALADLYERAGDLVRARDLFAWIRHHAPDFADVSGRLRALR